MGLGGLPETRRKLLGLLALPLISLECCESCSPRTRKAMAGSDRALSGMAVLGF